MFSVILWGKMSINGKQGGMEGRGNRNAEKLSKLKELLNCTGCKLLELKATLHTESITSGEDFDVSTYSPLITRYQNEIGTVDSLKMCLAASETSLQSFASAKQKYHFYFDELNNASFISSGTTLSNRENSSCLVRSADLSITPPLELEEVSQASDRKGTKVSSCDVGEDEIDAADSGHHQRFETSMGNVSSALKKVQIKDLQDINGNFGGVGVGEDDITNYDSISTVKSHESSFYVPKNKLDELCSSDVDWENYDGEKYKVVRKKIRHRGRVCEENFRAHRNIESSSKLKSPSPIYSSTPKNSSSRICVPNDDGNLMATGLDVKAALETFTESSSSKKTGESWFECRERFNVKMLQRRLSQELPRSEPRAPCSSFCSGDYLEANSSTVTSPSKSKCVRFSLSPSKRSVSRSFKKPAVSASNNSSKCSSDSSDENEISFDVGEFPRVGRRRRR